MTWRTFFAWMVPVPIGALERLDKAIGELRAELRLERTHRETIVKEELKTKFHERHKGAGDDFLGG